MFFLSLKKLNFWLRTQQTSISLGESYTLSTSASVSNVAARFELDAGLAESGINELILVY